MKIQWYSEAVEDLNQIYEYYVTKNARAAAMLYNGILDEIEILQKFPHSAPIEPLLKDLSEEYRSLSVAKGKYKIIYYIEQENVFIVLVFGCWQNPRKLTLTTKKRRDN